MKKHFNIYLIPCCMLIFSLSSLAENFQLSFIDQKFDDFTKRVVAGKDQQKFAAYYSKLVNELMREDELKKRETYRYLFSKALNALKSDSNEWYQEISNFLSIHKGISSQNKNNNLVKVQTFLRRYGAYAAFQEVENSQLLRPEHQERVIRAGIFSQIGAFFSQITKSVVTWFWRN